MNAVHGVAELEYEPVRRAFEQNFVDRDEIGAALCVIRDGHTVVNLWGGMADRPTLKPWAADTVCPIFSGTKGLVAVCMLMLVDRDLIDLDQPVTTYWPEFGRHGKDAVTVRHVMSHTAGVPGLLEPLSTTGVADDRLMAERVVDAELFWEPGSVICYHGLTFGWMCGELVRRVDGRSIGQFFREEVAAPLDLDTWIGLPPEEDGRVATLYLHPSAVEDAAPPDDPRMRAVASRQLIFGNNVRFPNSEQWRRAEIPGGNAISDAASLARLYWCLSSGGRLGDVRLMSAETIREAREVVTSGRDELAGDPLAYGVGFSLQTEVREFGPPDDAFGHCGAGGSVHGAWPSQRLAFSYVMNSVRGDLQTSGRLLDALWEIHGTPSARGVRSG